MYYEKEANWKGWKDVQDWAKSNGFKKLAERLQFNNDNWMSSGEFGRDQVARIDALRFAKSKEEALDIASKMEKELSGDIVEDILKEAE